MIYSVVMQLQWTPNQIDSLYLDADDYLGLEYWYNQVAQYSKDIKKAGTPK